MNCQIALNAMSAYLDRELTGDEMMALRAHVARCDSCRAELESLRALKAGLGGLKSVEVRPGLAGEVMRRVRQEPAATARLPWQMMVATSVAAAVLAVLLFNTFFARPARPQASNDNGFDAASDSAVTSPEFGSTAPLIPVGR